ncbi:MAG: UMP kinase [Patescibacteria group bacterium]
MNNWSVISLGGSIIVPDAISVSFLRRFRTLLLSFPSRRFAIICGGGNTNRIYNAAAKAIGKPTDDDLDWIGIRSLTLNAELLRSAFGSQAYASVIANPADLKQLPKERIIIGAAYKPGCSSDLDAVLWAKRLQSKLVLNLSNITHVYSADPKRDKSAVPLSKLSWPAYRRIVGNHWTPRLNSPFDPKAAALAEKLGIAANIMDGRKLVNVRRAIQGKSFVGTRLG